jgi:hypothetical protein
MSKPKRRKHYIEPKPADFEEAEKAEHGEVGEEGETEDIYESGQRERMLDNDEVSAAEEAFMRGRDEPLGKREIRRKTHDDDKSGRLAEEDTQTD